jgi:nucleotide-binding universal stress UspA family protein
MRSIRRVLVAVDFSECGDAALAEGIFMADRFAATVNVVHVWQPHPYLWEPLATAAGTDVQVMQLERVQAEQQLHKLLQPYPHVHGQIATGDPRDVVVSVARRGQYDLIVLGTHGRTGVARLILGSVAEGVLRNAPCPVLIVHADSRPHHPTIGDEPEAA